MPAIKKRNLKKFTRWKSEKSAIKGPKQRCVTVNHNSHMDLHFGAVRIKLNNLKRWKVTFWTIYCRNTWTKTAQVINIMLLVLFFVRSEGINILNMLTYIRHKINIFTSSMMRWDTLERFWSLWSCRSTTPVVQYVKQVMGLLRDSNLIW